ncbi:hypothetical protein [Acetivibrio straminisolvens]|uniref:Uncharacterized protein n=1 Tax=Acetivibrio straminisolvens JCM 21531 TaxID=1294263 RepID=W4V6C1_9FIRM|nr:hypothetical protein [Acetivibrio straminisolvens]GAE88742.1 hypothetical protein JCM21531_2215 [Acetivibrio straminisolvens JCM 21531]
MINIKNISPAIVNILVFDEITKLHGRDLLFNPFFKAPPITLSFVTYTMVSNIPNGIINFKFRLTDPMNELMHETKINAVDVKDNAFSNVLIWNNVNFKMLGEHTITFYLATETGFEPTGSTVIIVDNLPVKP